jgi:hypothetical protein
MFAERSSGQIPQLKAMGPAPGFWFGFDGVAYAIDFVEMAVGRSVCMERIISA